MGPKGIRKRTLQRLVSTTEVSEPQGSDRPNSGYANTNASTEDHSGVYQERQRTVGQIDNEKLALYLDIYNHKMYPVWPVVDVNTLVLRLTSLEPDVEAYMLAASVCAATILKLQLVTDQREMPTAQAMIDEVEQLRFVRRYRQQPSLDSVRTSFFMHIAYLHIGQRMSCTLLLKESISMAHLLNLHNTAFYADLSHREEQISLRILWLLFITDRAHASQYDVPTSVTLPISLPPLDSTNQELSLDAFTLLCNMFAHFSQAFDNPSSTNINLTTLDVSLRSLPMLSRQHNTIQSADALVTRQWMRLSLWKLAVSQLPMSAGPMESLDSILFPIQATRDLLSTISQLSIDALEAHGPGMELKLFEFASSLADVITCLPVQPDAQMSGFGPKDSLVHLATILGSFRGGSHALMPILQARLGDVGLDVPSVPRVVDVSGESNESDFTESSHGLEGEERGGADTTTTPFRQYSPTGSLWSLDVVQDTSMMPTHFTEYVDEPD